MKKSVKKKIEMELLRLFICLISLSFFAESKRILFVMESESARAFGDTLQKELKGTYEVQSLLLNKYAEEVTLNESCISFSSPGIAGIVDATIDSDLLKKFSASLEIPYVKIRLSNEILFEIVLQYVVRRKGEDVIFLTESDDILSEAVTYSLSVSRKVRILASNVNKDGAMEKIRRIRPLPQYFVAYGSSETIVDIFKKAAKINLIKRTDRWIFLPTDDRHSQILKQISPIEGSIAFVLFNFENFSSDTVDFYRESLFKSTATFLKNHIIKDLQPSLGNCRRNGDPMKETRSPLPELLETFPDADSSFLYSNSFLNHTADVTLVLKNDTASIEIGSVKKGRKPVVLWTPRVKLRTLPKHLRIGVVEAVPWLLTKKDKNGKEIKDEKTGQFIYTGYCIDMIEEFSKRLFFEYDLVPPTTGLYGILVDNETWDGVIGDVVSGEIDIAIADLTPTLEREEFVDFISPYFAQTGMAIILRKPVKERPLFKFMEVLKKEVWISILGALIFTAILLWFLEKYSPFSARNNTEKYKEPQRIFDLKESFWFAITSFTPQGGGDSPKSISGRVLAAAYWLFVALIVATFAANLAAFLTVERMQTSIKTLDELIHQSKINFSVVEDSFVHDYFRNLAKAEDDLYGAWRDMSHIVNKKKVYRVWNYPVKESYNYLLEAIESAGTVKTYQDGFKRVLDDDNGLFAFIHDSLSIRYEYYINCNYSTTSEPFGEQPLGMVVSQGSPLASEFSVASLKLKEENFFDLLDNKYWNSTYRSTCPVLDDSEGITLRSLGGVFICTVIGLLLSVIILIYEEVRRRHRSNNVVQNITIVKQSYS